MLPLHHNPNLATHRIERRSPAYEAGALPLRHVAVDPEGSDIRSVLQPVGNPIRLVGFEPTIIP